MIKAILFDLDGTLLPVDTDVFLRADLSGIGVRLAALGYDPEDLKKIFRNSFVGMLTNNGTKTNQEAFWEQFRIVLGEKVMDNAAVIEKVYWEEFQELKSQCGLHPMAAQVVRRAKELGYRVILATNPVFPASITHSRIMWAGLQPQDFEMITTFENSSFCKPKLEYYREVLSAIGLEGEECLMVGNDTREDMVAEDLGMKTFLLTDYLINKENRDITQWNHGSFPELIQYIQEL
jgi:FMN phosphatase YigB (HAD superfamily)